MLSLYKSNSDHTKQAGDLITSSSELTSEVCESQRLDYWHKFDCHDHMQLTYQYLILMLISTHLCRSTKRANVKASLSPALRMGLHSSHNVMPPFLHHKDSLYLEPTSEPTCSAFVSRYKFVMWWESFIQMQIIFARSKFFCYGTIETGL
jgi:hypothetical protein